MAVQANVSVTIDKGEEVAFRNPGLYGTEYNLRALYGGYFHIKVGGNSLAISGHPDDIERFAEQVRAGAAALRQELALAAAVDTHVVAGK